LSPRKVKRLGLKNVEVDNRNGSLILELSSKILKENYFELINLNNLEETFEKVKRCNIIDFDTNKLIDSSNVLRCDVTNNLKLTRDVSKVISELQIYGINNKYSCNPYPDTNTAFKDSVVFKRKVRSPKNKETQIIYGKFNEVTRNNAENRELLKYFDPELFRFIARVESRFANLQQMRMHFNTVDLSLVNVLSSQEQVNAKIFDKITNIQNIEFETIKNYKILFAMSSQMNDSKIKKTLGELEVLRLCDNDIDLIKLYLRQNKIRNKARALRRYREVLKKVNEFDTGELEMDKSVNEIKSLLRVA